MRIHVFTNPTIIDPAPANIMTLGPRHAMTLRPDSSGAAIRVELEAMMNIEPGVLVMVVAAPSVLELGLRPALPVSVSDHRDPPGPLVIWMEPPAHEVRLELGQPLARVIIVEQQMQRFFHDLTLVDQISPVFAAVPYVPAPETDKQPETGFHQEDVQSE